MLKILPANVAWNGERGWQPAWDNVFVFRRLVVWVFNLNSLVTAEPRLWDTQAWDRRLLRLGMSVLFVSGLFLPPRVFSSFLPVSSFFVTLQRYLCLSCFSLVVWPSRLLRCCPYVACSCSPCFWYRNNIFLKYNFIVHLLIWYHANTNRYIRYIQDHRLQLIIS